MNISNHISFKSKYAPKKLINKTGPFYNYSQKYLINTPKQPLKSRLKLLASGLISSLLVAWNNLKSDPISFLGFDDVHTYNPESPNNTMPTIPDHKPSAIFSKKQMEIPTQGFGTIQADKYIVSKKIMEAKNKGKNTITIVLECEVSDVGSAENFKSYRKQILDLNENLLKDISYNNGEKITKEYEPKTRREIKRTIEKNNEYKKEIIYNNDTITISETTCDSKKEKSTQQNCTRTVSLINKDGIVLKQINKRFDTFSEAISWDGKTGGITYTYNPETKEITIGNRSTSPEVDKLADNYRNLVNDIIKKTMTQHIVKKENEVIEIPHEDYSNYITITKYFGENNQLICERYPEFTKYYLKDENQNTIFKIGHSNKTLEKLKTEIYEDCELTSKIHYDFKSGITIDTPEMFIDNHYQIK